MRTTSLGASLLVLLMPAVSLAGKLGPFTLTEAVAFALEHHPAVHRAQAAATARRAEVSVARAGYLPHLDASLQLNDGTGNVLRGPLFAVPGIPPISGPPIGRSIGDTGFGTLAGVGASWDALGIVAQIARVDAALAGEDEARAGIAVERLEIAYLAADRFLTVLAQEGLVRSADANVARAKALASTIDALAAQQLRPGADASRAHAELALAMTQLIRARQADSVSGSALAQALGAAGQNVTVRAGELLSLRAEGTRVAAINNPLLAQVNAAVENADARARSVQWEYLPRLNLVASLWVRGSGLTNGPSGIAPPPSPNDGLTPDTPNWAVGLVLSWPALEMVAVQARSRVAQAEVEVTHARRDELEQEIQTQLEVARTILDSARKAAANTPVALEAARAAESQATSRYRAGLATVVEVAEAQRLLAQAEADDAVARIDVLRAELLLARAVGDLEPFFAQVRSGGR